MGDRKSTAVRAEFGKCPTVVLIAHKADAENACKK